MANYFCLNTELFVYFFSYSNLIMHFSVTETFLWVNEIKNLAIHLAGFLSPTFSFQ